MEKELLSAREVCDKVGCSLVTLNNWYRFKKLNPENELAQMLPLYVNNDFEPGRPRYWNVDDVTKLIAFKNSLVRGRYGTKVTVR